MTPATARPALVRELNSLGEFNAIGFYWGMLLASLARAPFFRFSALLAVRFSVSHRDFLRAPARDDAFALSLLFLFLRISDFEFRVWLRPSGRAVPLW
jgi:hypothetical protein